MITKIRLKISDKKYLPFKRTFGRKSDYFKRIRNGIKFDEKRKIRDEVKYENRERSFCATILFFPEMSNIQTCQTVIFQTILKRMYSNF